MDNIHWVCPECKTQNVDDVSHSDFVGCVKCDSEFNVESIVHLSDDLEAYKSHCDVVSQEQFGVDATYLLGKSDALKAEAIGVINLHFSLRSKPHEAVDELNSLRRSRP